MPAAVSAAIACAEVLDQLPPVIVVALEDQTLQLVDDSHRVAAAQQAGRTTQPVERSAFDTARRGMRSGDRSACGTSSGWVCAANPAPHSGGEAYGGPVAKVRRGRRPGGDGCRDSD